MKFSLSHTLSLSALAPLAAAFPAGLLEEVRNSPELAARATEILKRQSGADAATALFEPVPMFNATAQYVDVTGAHAWVAPGKGDLRGPCPGLNAFANHNYLPHDGYATIEQFVDITMEVVGMGPLLAGFLAVLGATLDGDLDSWSIAGTPPASIGGGNGLSGSHNKYESDASPTRPDLYQAGNNYKTDVKQFQQMIDASPGGVVTIDSLTAFRASRFNTQKTTNPYFFNGPFSGVLVQPAAYTFIFRFMANHSAEFPVGQLTHETVASWFGVTGTSGNYTATQGYERIPPNWYKRAIAYPYEIPYFMADVLNAAALHPEFLDVGGNTGTANSFTGVDVKNLTGGLFNSASLAKGNNLGCFAFQFAAQAEPDVALPLITSLQTNLGKIVSQLSCPQLQAINDADLEDYPGYKKSNVRYNRDILGVL